MAGPCAGVVSVQRVSAANAVDGHLSWGALIDSNAVIAPAGGEWLTDPGVEFEVLLASARERGPGYVERIRVKRANVVAVTSAEPSLLNLKLIDHARHRPSVGTFDKDVFLSRLRENPDIWQALVDMRVIPVDPSDYDEEVVLGPVVEWERSRRIDLVREKLIDPRDVTGFTCCPIVCFWCEPCPRRWW